MQVLAYAKDGQLYCWSVLSILGFSLEHRHNELQGLFLLYWLVQVIVMLGLWEFIQENK